MIDWLVRKPGAFKDYRYQADLFPNSRFRMVFDALNEQHAEPVATKGYLGILHLAASENENQVDLALQSWLNGDLPLSVAAIKEAVLLASGALPSPREIQINEVDLASFDSLFTSGSFMDEPAASEFISDTILDPNSKDQHDTEVSYQEDLERFQANGEAGIEYQSESRSSIKGTAATVVS